MTALGQSPSLRTLSRSSAKGWKAAIRSSGFVGLLIAVPLAAAIGVIIRFAIREYHLRPPEVVNEPAPALPLQEGLPPRKNSLYSGSDRSLERSRLRAPPVVKHKEHCKDREQHTGQQ